MKFLKYETNIVHGWIHEKGRWRLDERASKKKVSVRHKYSAVMYVTRTAKQTKFGEEFGENLSAHWVERGEQGFVAIAFLSKTVETLGKQRNVYLNSYNDYLHSQISSWSCTELWEIIRHSKLRVDMHIIYTFILYLTGNTLRLRYRAQPVNAVWGNSHCLLWEPYGTNKYIVWALQFVPHRKHITSPLQSPTG
jgi:hypothetical protein